MKKTALVTGGTSGIGLSLVKELARLNFRVFFIGLSREKGKRVENEINNRMGYECKFIQLDLSDLESVHRFASNFIKELTQLDLLANVAGVLLPVREETASGIEKNLAISYFSTVILSMLLIPSLEKSQQARIVNVGAQPNKLIKAELNFDDFNFTKGYNGFKASLLSVHAKTVFTQLLSEKLNGRNITVNSFNPGMVKSNLTRFQPKWMQMIMKFSSLFMEKVAKTGIYTCISPDLNTVSGHIIDKKQTVPLQFDRNYVEKLWKHTANQLKEKLGIILEGQLF